MNANKKFEVNCMVVTKFVNRLGLKCVGSVEKVYPAKCLVNVFNANGKGANALELIDNSELERLEMP